MSSRTTGSAFWKPNGPIGILAPLAMSRPHSREGELRVLTTAML